MRKTRKKEKTGFVLRQQTVLEADEEKKFSAAGAYIIHGLLLFIWIGGCLKWIDEVLILHIAMAPLLLALGIFCLLFEAAVRLNRMWEAIGAAACFILGYVWFSRALCLDGVNMLAGQAAEAIAEYYHLDSEIENVLINSDILLCDFVLLAAFLVLIVGAATVKWRTGTVPGMLFIVLLTASLMIDRFPEISTLLMVLAGTAGLIAVMPVDMSMGPRKKTGFTNGQGYVRTGLYAVCTVLLAGGIGYGVSKVYVAEKMHSYYDGIKEYPQQMIAAMQQLISGKDGEISQLEQWMGGIAAGLNAVDGQLTNTAPVQTGAVALRVDTTVKPETALYFKSYIGGAYDADREQWQGLDDEAFHQAYANWESAAALPYDDVKSLLAMGLYNCLSEAALTESCSYYIENISADQYYTWAPYGVDVSGTAIGADGILAGGSQSLFAGYAMMDTHELMDILPYMAGSSYNPTLMSDYRDYVYETYLEVPDNMQAMQAGYERLYQSYQGASAIDWIEAVQRELENTCTYERYGLSAAPAGSNIIDNFYGSQKEGYCIHFASAGVMLLRMAGIPARYVTGYVAWPGDFHYDEDGECYHADITGYRGHAWAEVYVDELGIWLPVEMTPADSVQNLGPDDSAGQNADDREMTETAQRQTEASEASGDQTEAFETSEGQKEADPIPETAKDHREALGDDADPPLSGDSAGENGQVSQEYPSGERGTENRSRPVLPLALAAIVIVAAGIYLYIRRNSSDIRRFSKVNRNKGVLSMEWYLTEVMELAGWPAEQNMDDWSYAQWVQEKVDTLEEGEYIFFMEKLHQAAYSEEMLSEEDYQKCFATYRKIIDQILSEMKGIKKLWWQYVKGYRM